APRTTRSSTSSTGMSSPESSADQPGLEPGTGDVSKPAETFKELGLVDSLCEACDALGWLKPTPIQCAAIPPALKNRDIIGLSETGSGKTGAFALPILHGLLASPSPFYALVLAPTRELAVQIAQSFKALGSGISLRCATILGGMDMVSQAIELGKKPHVIVATPGRLLDHLEKTKGFSLSKLKYLVIDEADRLLDMDFGPSLEKILKFIPRERRTALFSATMSSQVESLQRASLKDPLRISVKTNKYQTVATLRQSMVFVPQIHKDAYFVHLINEFFGQFIVVFARTVYETQRLALLLRALGFGAIPLHGKLSQSSRLAALNKISSGTRDILIATDVAARGLDIPRVGVVINYDMPGDSKIYVHRVGRTARAGKSGHAINVVTQYEIELFQRIEKALGREGKTEVYEIDKEEVMTLKPRVEEAQRQARTEMREMDLGGDRRQKKLKNRRKANDDRDREEV
ncbi:ATP-dependent rRNA helicase rrp3-like protein, partial [Thozetella sp. PMI_491]